MVSAGAAHLLRGSSKYVRATGTGGAAKVVLRARSTTGRSCHGEGHSSQGPSPDIFTAITVTEQGGCLFPLCQKPKSPDEQEENEGRHGAKIGPERSRNTMGGLRAFVWHQSSYHA